MLKPRGVLDEVIGGQDDADRVAAQLLAPQAARDGARRLVVLLGDGDLELAEGDRGQGDLGLELLQLDAQAGVALAEGDDRGRDEREQRRLQRADAHPAGDDPGRRLQLGLGDLQALEQSVGVLDQPQTRLGQLQPPPDALGQRHARLALERGQALRDG